MKVLKLGANGRLYDDTSGEEMVVIDSSGAERKVPTLTAANAIMAGDTPVSGGRINRSVASKCFFGRLKTVAMAADHTSHAQFTLDAPCDMMRIGVLNGTGADLVNVKVSLGKLSQTGNKAGTTVNAGTAINATFSGSASGTVAGVGGTTDDPLVTWTDWMSMQSLDRTDATGSSLWVHNVRIELPVTGNANRPAWYHTDTSGWQDENLTTAPFARVLRLRQQAVLAASTANAALFTSTTFAGDVIPFIVQYVPRMREVFSLLVLGNSIDEGAGATVSQHGWPMHARNSISTPEQPVEICNLAVGGAGSLVFAQRAERLIPQILPSAVYVPSFNPNDTAGTNAQIQSTEIDYMRLMVARVQAVCDRLNIPVLTSTGIPTNASVNNYGATDSLRVAHNAAILAYRTRRVRPVVDFDSVMQGVVNGSGQMELPAGATADGIHPNTVGYADRMAPLAVPQISKLF